MSQVFHLAAFSRTRLRGIRYSCVAPMSNCTFRIHDDEDDFWNGSEDDDDELEKYGSNEDGLRLFFLVTRHVKM